MTILDVFKLNRVHALDMLNIFLFDSMYSNYFIIYVWSKGYIRNYRDGIVSFAKLERNATIDKRIIFKYKLKAYATRYNIKNE